MQMCCYVATWHFLLQVQAAGLFILQGQQRGCISAERSQEAGLGLGPRLRQDVLPSASVSSYGKGEDWPGLDEFFGSFNIHHALSLYSRDLKLIPCSFWREMYHISVTGPQAIVPQTLTLLNAKTRIAASDSCHPCHPTLSWDSVKMAKTLTSAWGTKYVGFWWPDCLPSW